MPYGNQLKYLSSNVNCSRFVYNWLLRFTIDFYATYNTFLTYSDIAKLLPGLKEDYYFLKNCSSIVMQQAARQLMDAYSRFFDNLKRDISPAGFPQFKKKKYVGSFKIVGKNSFSINKNKLKLPLFKLKEPTAL